MVRTIVTIAFSALFVVSTIVALFGLAKVIDVGIRHILDASMIVCEPYYPTEGRDTLPPDYGKFEGKCHPDIRFLKERLAEGLSMFFAASPLAYILYRQIRRKEANS